MSSIILAAIAPVDPLYLSLLTEPIGKTFSRSVKVAQPPLLDGSFAFNFSRNQYSSTSILSALLEKFSEWVPSEDRLDCKILGVTEGDLFVPVLTYVFGEAQFVGKAAVVSSHRLHEEFYGLQSDESIFKTRLVKEAIHELGHTFGLIHCNNYLCVMHSSTGVEEIDMKTEKLCEDCRMEFLSKNLTQ
ncbi:MAG: archaemetzincin family Zn-dependent metalloprotease [Candidatus Kryptoniota bacterium]